MFHPCLSNNAHGAGSVQPATDPLQETSERTLTPCQQINLIILGAGNVAGAWLELFTAQRQSIRERLAIDLQISVIANSTHWLQSDAQSDAALSPEHLIADLKAKGTAYTQDELCVFVREQEKTQHILLDLTISESLGPVIEAALSSRCHIISANKNPLAGARNDVAHWKQIAQLRGNRWLSNATVGAALPIQASIADLQQAGDRIHKLQGILSGTLSWLFSKYDPAISFTQLLKQAHAEGLTEPDPRVDLSGHDVLRKTLILARDIGLEIDAQDIATTDLLPGHLLEGSLEDFWQRSDAIDAHMASAYNQAHAQNKRLVYLANVNANGQISAGLDLVDAQSSLASLRPGENILEIYSDAYAQVPLTISGPGAGLRVTASAVQSDLYQLCIS